MKKRGRGKALAHDIQHTGVVSTARVLLLFALPLVVLYLFFYFFYFCSLFRSLQCSRANQTPSILVSRSDGGGTKSLRLHYYSLPLDISFFLSSLDFFFFFRPFFFIFCHPCTALFTPSASFSHPLGRGGGPRAQRDRAREKEEKIKMDKKKKERKHTQRETLEWNAACTQENEKDER